MKVKLYAVLDAKVGEFHLAIFDLKDEGAIRQFSDHIQNPQTPWNKHPEDYSIWHVGEFDTTTGMTLDGVIPRNLVNASALTFLKNQIPVQPELFNEKTPVN